jgi:hypothetical protein
VHVTLHVPLLLFPQVMSPQAPAPLHTIVQPLSHEMSPHAPGPLQLTVHCMPLGQSKLLPLVGSTMHVGGFVDRSQPAAHCDGHAPLSTTQ